MYALATLPYRALQLLIRPSFGRVISYYNIINTTRIRAYVILLYSLILKW